MVKSSDQFEVNTNVDYSGSYTDFEFSDGSIFENTRRTWYSKSNTPVTQTGWSTLVYRSWAEIRHPADLSLDPFFRNTFNIQGYQQRTANLSHKFLSEGEIFADSVLPRPPDIALINGAKFCEGPGFEYSGPLTSSLGQNLRISSTPAKFKINIGSGIISGQNAQLTSSSDDSIVSDNIWAFSFPFEQRYRDLPKFLNQGLDQNFIVTHSGSMIKDEPGEHVVVDHPTPFTSSLYTLQWVFVDSVGTRDLTTLLDSEVIFDSNGFLLEPNISSYSRTKRILKGFYGSYSKKTTSIIQGGASPFVALSNPGKFPNSPIAADVTASQHETSWAKLLIDSWKYGVYHANPQKSRAYWRRGRFGQFRDILEQRPFTKYFDASTKAALGAAVSIKFVGGSAASVTASNPTELNLNASGIYDFEGKSGRPFNDSA